MGASNFDRTCPGNPFAFCRPSLKTARGFLTAGTGRDAGFGFPPFARIEIVTLYSDNRYGSAY